MMHGKSNIKFVSFTEEIWLWRTTLRGHMDSESYCVSTGGLKFMVLAGNLENCILFAA
jgi:hypothetical protein